MKKLSISLSGHQTSISLEKEFADALKQIATTDQKSVSEIINEIDKNRNGNSNLSSEIRLWILRRLLKTVKL